MRTLWLSILAVCAMVSVCLVPDAQAVSKSCRLIPATHPGAENVLSHHLYRVAAVSTTAADLAAADAALATVAPIRVPIDTPPEGRNLAAYVDVSGVTYRMQIAAVNANGEGPRSDIQSVSVDGAVTPPPPGPVPSKAAFSIVCP